MCRQYFHNVFICYKNPTYFSGLDCSIHAKYDVWERVTYYNGSIKPHGRASHKAVLQGNKIWVVAGENFLDNSFHQMAR